MSDRIRALLLVIILLLPAVSAAQVTPTSEWVNVWSDATTFNTNPIPAGSVIRVYDPDGVLCGEEVVTAPGTFGFVPVYRDDPMTPSIDEGAEPGDELTFTVDDIPAEVLGPDAPTWTFNGDGLRVNLAVERVFSTSEWISCWSSLAIVDGAPAAVGTVIRAYDPAGVLCGEFVVTTFGSYGLMPVYRDDPGTPNFDEGAEPGDIIAFTIDGAVAEIEGPDNTEWTVNGDVKNIGLRVGPVLSVRPTSWGRLKTTYR